MAVIHFDAKMQEKYGIIPRTSVEMNKEDNKC
jgi:hypothetical protein